MNKVRGLRLAVYLRTRFLAAVDIDSENLSARAHLFIGRRIVIASTQKKRVPTTRRSLTMQHVRRAPRRHVAELRIRSREVKSCRKTGVLSFSCSLAQALGSD